MLATSSPITSCALIASENTDGYGHVDGPMTDNLPMRPDTREDTVRADMWNELADAPTSLAGPLAATVRWFSQATTEQRVA